MLQPSLPIYPVAGIRTIETAAMPTAKPPLMERAGRASAEEAVALTEDIPDIAVVLSDIQLLGEGTGIDLIDRVQGSGLPCYLMTSLPENDPLYGAALLRAPVLRKPFGRDQLAQLLDPGTPE